MNMGYQKRTRDLEWASQLPVHCTLDEAAKELGMTKQGARALENRALRKIAKLLRQFASTGNHK